MYQFHSKTLVYAILDGNCDKCDRYSGELTETDDEDGYTRVKVCPRCLEEMECL